MIDSTNYPSCRPIRWQRKLGSFSNSPLSQNILCGCIFHTDVILQHFQINSAYARTSIFFNGFSFIAYNLMTSLLTPMRIKCVSGGIGFYQTCGKRSIQARNRPAGLKKKTPRDYLYIRWSTCIASIRITMLKTWHQVTRMKHSFIQEWFEIHPLLLFELNEREIIQDVLQYIPNVLSEICYISVVLKSYLK